MMTAEAIEGIYIGSIEAIRSTGANGFQALIYGVIPQGVSTNIGCHNL